MHVADSRAMVQRGSSFAARNAWPERWAATRAKWQAMAARWCYYLEPSNGTPQHPDEDEGVEAGANVDGDADVDANAGGADDGAADAGGGASAVGRLLPPKTADSAAGADVAAKVPHVDVAVALDGLSAARHSIPKAFAAELGN